MDVHKVDIETAFLHGDIDAEIYMKAPAQLGFSANSVVRLRKAIYGLKQASLIFHNKLHDMLSTHGFTRCSKESCLYVNGDGSDKIIIGVYVDDLMISTASPTRMQWIKDIIAAVFPCKDYGLVDNVIGIGVTRPTPNCYELDQSQYLDTILERFNVGSPLRKAGSPLDPNVNYTHPKYAILPAREDDATLHEYNHPYREAVGSILYATQCTRYDCAYAVSIVSAFMSRPTEEHWTAVKRILNYLRATPNRKLRYSRPSNPKHLNMLTGFCDSDFASDLTDRISRSGYVFFLNGAPISWKSCKQRNVALSSTEAEYYAMSLAVQELRFLRILLEELGFPQLTPSRMGEDNEGAIYISEELEVYRER